MTSSDDSLTENTPDRWEVDQDEFGRPRIRHRHPTGSVRANISRDADGVTSARCSECQERYLVRDAQRPANR
jgi:hypothetical protein